MIVGQDLKLSEIRKKKEELENSIAEMLAFFVNETGLKVTGVIIDCPIVWNEKTTDGFIIGEVSVAINAKI